jgi:hypothetical protein
MRAFTRRAVCFKHRGIQARNLNVMISPTQNAKQSTVMARDSTPVRRLRTTTTSSSHLHVSPTLTMVSPIATVDRTVFPSLSSDVSPIRESVRVPYLPDTFTRTSSTVPRQPEVIEQVFRAEISTVAHESTHLHPPSALSDVVDNGAISLDPYDLATKVSHAARRLSDKVVTKQNAGVPGVFRQVWSGLMDDVFGPSSSLKPA